MRKTKSPILAAVHDTAKGLHKAGMMDQFTMRDFDQLCLPRVEPLQPEQIKHIRETPGSSRPFLPVCSTPASRPCRSGRSARRSRPAPPSSCCTWCRSVAWKLSPDHDLVVAALPVDANCFGPRSLPDGVCPGRSLRAAEVAKFTPAGAAGGQTRRRASFSSSNCCSHSGDGSKPKRW